MTSQKMPLLLLVTAAILVPPLGKAQERGNKQVPKAAEQAQILTQARGLHLPPPRPGEVRAEGNLVGFRSPEVLFSHRQDSRTYFIQDLRPAQEKEEKLFQGPDKDYRERLNEIFRVLKIPPAEISEPRVLTEQTQEGYVDRATGKLTREKPRPGKRWLTAARKVEGVPVFSSRVVMTLSSDGRVGFMELHWPMIPADALRQAHQMQERIRGKWQAPRLQGAHVETVEAGILHSPAVSFVMDIRPVIRVTYAPNEKGLGKKAVRYVDINGRDVPPPRQFSQPLPTPPEKHRPNSKQTPG
jgi:hypothetical protein